MMNGDEGKLFPAEEDDKQYLVTMTGNEINAVHFAFGYMSSQKYRRSGIKEVDDAFDRGMKHIESASRSLHKQTE